GEVTRLLAVAVDLDRPTGLDRGDEARNDRGVLRERALTWPEDVEVAQNDRLERLVDAREAHAVALGGELRDRVWRDRVRRRLLGRRELLRRSVDRRRGRVDDPSHPLVARREEDVQRSFHVHG